MHVPLSKQAFEFVETFVNQTFFPTVELEFAKSFRNVTEFFLEKVNTIVQVPVVNKVTIYLTDIW